MHKNSASPDPDRKKKLKAAKYKRWLQKNRETRNQYQKEYWKRNAHKYREEAKERARKWREENPLFAWANSRKYYQDNKVSIAISTKDYRKKNSTKIKARRDKYVEANHSKVQQLTQRWKKENRSRSRTLARNASHRRRARLTHQPSDTYVLSFLKNTSAMTEFVCYLCNETHSGPPTVEHIIPISRGGLHSLGNLAHSCPSCNFKKIDKTYEEYIDWRRKKKHEREKAVRLVAPTLLGLLASGDVRSSPASS